jgi:heme-degrading monooxygenase HmoA
VVIEHADITVSPSDEAAFEAAFERGRRAIARAPGHQWDRLVRQVENPERYLLLVGWDSVQAHMDFRATELFTEWRAAVGPFFAGPVEVTHYQGVFEGEQRV